ncbi:MAG: tetratricopeptide repeat protein [Rhodothermales bacterium]
MSNLARIGTWSLLLLLLVAATGCGRMSFLGQRFDNFTAYYNTFYNAEQAYEGALSAMEGVSEEIDRSRYIAVFGGPSRSGGNVGFQNAIDKCADVLREHPRSKWVDDALLLIGKSYLYQENYIGAEQKFREVVEMNTGLEDEARIWLARTLIAAGAYDDARGHLISSLELEDVSERYEPQLRIALGELLTRLESFEDAAVELERGMEDVRDNEIEAKTTFLLGQVYETLGRYEEAVDAYRRVPTAHPRYELAYAANVSAVRVQGLHLDPSQALDQLRRLERDDKNYANRFELAYVRGRIYQARGQAEDARSMYREILYDPEAQVGDLRGRLHYALAELYRDEFQDYTVASAHFDSARTAFSSRVQSTRASSVPKYAPEAITDAPQQAETFKSFADVRVRIARMDSLLELGQLDEKAFQERILEMRRQRAEDLAEQQRLAAQRQAERGFQDAAGRSAGAASTSSSAAQNTGQAGFLFHRDPVRVQEARMNFIAQWGERPRLPNWRRTAAIAASAGAETGPLAGTDLEAVDQAAQSSQLPPIDYSEVPRDSASQADMKTERALARYELGNVLFLAMDRPDSAATWYRRVIEEDADEEVARRAYYALAEVQRSLGDTAAARQIYEQVLREYPDSDFAGRVREQLGMDQPASIDSLTIAMSDYDEAFARWRQGFYAGALDSMVVVAARYPKTNVAPKALLAAGRIYLEWADEDSLDVFAPLPITVSDSLLKAAGLLKRAESPRADSTASSQSEDSVASGQADGVPPPADEAPRRRVELQDEGEDPAGNTAPSDRFRDEPARDDEELLVDGRNEISPDDAELDDDLHRDMERDSGGDPGSTLENDGRRDTEDVVDGIADSTPTGAAADSTLTDAASDSLLTGAAADSSAVPADDPGDDPATTADDSLAVAQRSDSLEADSTITTSGLIAAAQDNAVYLKTLYASVRERYPSTPYAEQAGDMLDALERKLREMEAPPLDSAAVRSMLAATSTWGAVGSLLADSLFAPPSDSVLAGALPADTTEVPTTADDATSVPADSTALWSEKAILPEEGGYTIVLDAGEERDRIDAVVAEYRAKGYQAGVLEMSLGGTTIYRAAVGQFAGPEAAARALEEHRDEYGAGAQVVPIDAP